VSLVTRAKSFAEPACLTVKRREILRVGTGISSSHNLRARSLVYPHNSSKQLITECPPAALAWSEAKHVIVALIGET
jgi:hypothetical protein